MSHNVLPTHQNEPSHQAKLVSSGILILEAAIATLVLSIFATTNPSLFATQTQSVQPTAVNNTSASQNHLLSVRLPIESESVK